MDEGFSYDHTYNTVDADCPPPLIPIEPLSPSPYRVISRELSHSTGDGATLVQSQSYDDTDEIELLRQRKRAQLPSMLQASRADAQPLPSLANSWPSQTFSKPVKKRHRHVSESV